MQRIRFMDDKTDRKAIKIAAAVMGRSNIIATPEYIDLGKSGSPSWVRTNGHSINSRMLYH